MQVVADLVQQDVKKVEPSEAVRNETAGTAE
jgi:hypothetical protein